MNYGAFRNLLLAHPTKNLRFVLPEGDPIARDFHVTEVGHVAKNFVDCGGTKRTVEAVVLQVWVAANDPDHRLTGAKLAAILDLAKAVVPSDALDVEVEYEGCVLSQYPLVDFKTTPDELSFSLVEKHTDCLAREACGLESCGCVPEAAVSSTKCC